MKRFLSLIFAPLLLIAAVSLTGCPDRSYQRPVPDYENMTDDGSEIESEYADEE